VPKAAPPLAKPREQTSCRSTFGPELRLKVPRSIINNTNDVPSDIFICVVTCENSNHFTISFDSLINFVNSVISRFINFVNPQHFFHSLSESELNI